MKTVRPARIFLFLQGNASGFFSALAQTLGERGHGVRRINFNGGDRLFWPHRGAIDYRGSLKRWPAFLEARMRAWGVTDVILFGDCRPLHIPVRDLAARIGVRVHVFEEGYLRPNWITLEDGGVNGHSDLPRDPDWFVDEALQCVAGKAPAAAPDLFSRRAWEDVAYTISSLVASAVYPGYRTHRPWHPLWEYAGWITKFISGKKDRASSQKKLCGLWAAKAPYYLFPLQLDCDTQIRIHSPFKRMAPSIEAVVGSFARHAPKDTVLVVKEHPLDNRLTDWSKVLLRAANRHGVADRTLYIEAAPLEPLLERARGVVTVNSTTGLASLALGVPTVALGSAIYDMPRLTHQGGLDSFWSGGAPPCGETFDAFRRVIEHYTQVNGGFFSPEGLALATQNAADRLERGPRGIGPGSGVSACEPTKLSALDAPPLVAVAP